jgi:hypothetical protein
LVKEVTDNSTSKKRLQELAEKHMELARLVADNPATPPDLLKSMIRRRDKTILGNLVANPNTPTEVLFKLGKRFPEQFLKNPILSLLLLENTHFLSEIPTKTVQQIMEHSLKQLSGDGVQSQENEFLTPEYVLQLLAKHKDSSIRYRMAENIATPISILQLLADDKNDYVRQHVALNINTPIYLLEKLAKDNAVWTRETVAQNPNTPLSVLEYLVDDNHYRVCMGVACNPKTPVHMLERVLDKLTSDSHHQYVLTRTAENPKVAVYILEKLATCEIWEVRRGVAQNCQTPAITLKAMVQVKKEHWLVLKSIARNINTPIDVLQTMASDNRKSIRVAAIDNLNYRQKQQRV